MAELTNNRRPIASRNSGWAKATAAWLAGKGFSPNFISLLSIVFALLTFSSFLLDYKLNTHHLLFMLLAAAGIQARLLMNLFDGMVAVEYGKKSIAGALFNEVPDRLSDSLIIVGAGIMVKGMPFGMDLAYVAAILAIMTAYIRALGASLNCGHFFTGPMAKQQRMFLLTIGSLVAIWYVPVFYYIFILMNVGLVITCYIRLNKIYNALKQINT